MTQPVARPGTKPARPQLRSTITSSRTTTTKSAASSLAAAGLADFQRSRRQYPHWRPTASVLASHSPMRHGQKSMRSWTAITLSRQIVGWYHSHPGFGISCPSTIGSFTRILLRPAPGGIHALTPMRGPRACSPGRAGIAPARGAEHGSTWERPRGGRRAGSRPRQVPGATEASAPLADTRALFAPFGSSPRRP